MKKLLLLTIAMLTMVFGFVSYVSSTEGSNLMSKLTQNYKELSDYDVRGIYKSLVHFTPILANKNGTLKDSYYHRARQQANEFKQNSKSAKRAVLQWEELGPNNVGGRTRGILVDKTNSNLIYAGSAGGGLWISRNGAETWKPYAHNAELPVLAIGSIVQSSDGTVYFATGEPSNGEDIGIYGGFVPSEGIFKLTGFNADGEDPMFEQLASTVPGNTNSIEEEWSRINRVAVHPTNSNLLLATLNKFGVKLSTDGGGTWASPQGLPTDQTAYDIELSVDGSIVYVAIQKPLKDTVDVDGEEQIIDIFGTDLYKSTDGGGSFNKLDDNQLFIKYAGRTEIAISPENSDYVYVSYANSNGFFIKALRTTDGGNTWQKIGTYDEEFLNPFSSSGSPQGWYDHALVVDPLNKNRIFLGGILLWSWSETDNWRKLDNLADIGVNPMYIHADKHEFAFDPENPKRLFIACDGGVFRSSNASETQPTFLPRNKKYNVTQFYAVGADDEGRVLAGAQDNGTSYIDYIGTSRQSADVVSGGDGGFADISHIDGNILFASAQNGRFFRSPDKGQNFATYLEGTCIGTQNFPDTLFITPYLLWEDLFEYRQDEVKFERFNEYVAEVAAYQAYVQDSIKFANEEITVEPERVDPPNYTPEELRDIIPNSIIYTGGKKVIAALDALNVSGISECFVIGDMGGSQQNPNIMSAVSITEDGKTLWAGSNNGTLRRVNGLKIDSKNPNKNGWEYDGLGFPTRFLAEDTAAVNPDTLGSSWSRLIPNLPFEGEYITSVNVHPLEPQYVIVTTGGFDKENNVYLATNGRGNQPLFEPIKGTGDNILPAMPVYDAVFDQTGTTWIYAATELGVWAYNIDEQKWYEENDGLGGRVKTLQIRQEQIKTSNCPVTYIATHGRGLFRAVNGTPATCNTDLPEVALDVDEAVEQVQQKSFTIQPNPIQNEAIVNFNLNKTTAVNFRVVGMNGQIIQEKQMGKLAAGNNKFTFNRENLPAGSYVFALIIDKQIISKQVVIAD